MKVIKGISDTKTKVYELLMTLPSTRDCDNKLIAFYHAEEVGGLDAIKNLSAYEYLKLIIANKLTNPSNISRARRKIQETYPETRGLQYEKRKLREKEVRENIKNI